MKKIPSTDLTGIQPLQNLMIGRTFRVHPASDWFMRGATSAKVTSINVGAGIAYVRLFNGLEITPKRSRRISLDHLIATD